MAAILLPDRIIRDPTFDLPTRILGALQLAGGLGAWTPPLSRAEIASHIGASPIAVGRRLATLASAGYVKRQSASLPRGGRAWRYFVPAETSAKRLPPLS